MTTFDISRRTFVKAASIAGVSAAIFGLSGCAPKTSTALSSTGAFVPGTYTAAGQGKFGPVTIEATFSKTARNSIALGSSTRKTKFISARALTDIPRPIIEHQSLAIDTITGATLSSMAVINAVRDCTKQAGASDLPAPMNRPLPRRRSKSWKPMW